MKYSIFKIFIYLILFASCTKRNIVYFSDLPYEEINSEIMNRTDHRIQPIDLLNISVSTLNPESNLLFNRGLLTSLGGGSSGINQASVSESYRVDNNGYINFPVLGKVEVAGLTLEEANEKLSTYLQAEAKNPIVNIRIINFRITVIGEVRNPNTFPVPTERINILEAIGLAGDLTAFGRRENVLLVRDVEGVRTTVRLDLNKKDLFSSPYYYLQQNDIIYVEPVRARAEQGSMARANISLGFSVISIVTLLLTRFVL
ncbi:polysaccharide biosynthesis/export family protein [Litoribacter ruber]|uniref:polysaccharide biosynthesis/export family protein n=1 Tax=Litoribacter ruber TaxID=702568 RepID=UPI001BDAAA9C|nr:polysaccharide biosynthesis/export family protein [Litoribacter ruber]MBT0812307.1 polysaccharide biosynthesis/export family protein [Litoribacter ruber]